MEYRIWPRLVSIVQSLAINHVHRKSVYSTTAIVNVNLRSEDNSEMNVNFSFMENIDI